MRKFFMLLLGLFLLLLPLAIEAAPVGLPAINVTSAAGGGSQYSVSLQIIFFMTVLTLLPALLLTMTSFTRIIIVLAILRQAIGLNTTPTNQILLGLSLFLTFFIMTPVFNKVNTNALQPYLSQKMNFTQALDAAKKPMREFMLKQTRDSDLELFADLAGYDKKTTIAQLPMTVIMPAFLTSELKTAFQIGFLVFLPFLIIDIVVASVLMAMGMMMLSPLIISLPFKIMLFVLVDGWTLILGSLAHSFAM